MLMNSLVNFCRGMELLPADAHRIVALVEIPLTSGTLSFLSSFCDWHGIPDSIYMINSFEFSGIVEHRLFLLSNLNLFLLRMF